MTISENENLEKAIAKLRCEKSHLFFTRYFFKKRQGIKFRVNWHHKLIALYLHKVTTGEIKNLVINVAPGSSKTEMVVINFMARQLALNPRCRFLHISYSDDLALLNSQETREIVQSDEFQNFWPMKIADDAKAKKRWNVEIDGKRAGGVYAVSLGGQITGFRAGHMTEGFSGCIVLDDPLKADDAYSKPKRDAANRRLISTVKSRRANPDIPIILIMQRIAEEDPTGFIRSGQVPGEWTELIIPALIDDNFLTMLPDNIKQEVEINERDEHGRFSYWPYKEPLHELTELEKANRVVFSGQYQQEPVALGGNIIRSNWFQQYIVLPPLKYRIITADTAMKTKEHNDYSVFQCWGAGDNGRIYLIDQIRGKWEAPELKKRALIFWQKHHSILPESPLRRLLIEDKSSGTGLIQDIQASGGIPVKGIERNRDKLTRVMGAVPYIESGYIYLPENAAWLNDFLLECESFTADDTHAHDDQIDPLCDAIMETIAARPRGFFS